MDTPNRRRFLQLGAVALAAPFAARLAIPTAQAQALPDRSRGLSAMPDQPLPLRRKRRGPTCWAIRRRPILRPSAIGG
jgi:hypothetical protein